MATPFDLSVFQLHTTRDQATEALKQLVQPGKLSEVDTTNLQLALEEKFVEMGYPKGWIKLITSSFKRPKSRSGKSGEILRGMRVGENEGLSGSHYTVLGSEFPRNLEIAGKLNHIKELLAEDLLIVDPDYVDTVLALVASHSLHLTPLWMFMVGPPASGKTTLINMLRGLAPFVHPISNLTKNTLLSGWTPDPEKDKDQEDPSLLLKLKDNILTIAELGGLLGAHKDERNAIFSQLLEVFDGYSTRSTGRGEKSWEGFVSLLAGVTPQIDQFHQLMAKIGPRFLFYRLITADPKSMARAAQKQKMSPLQLNTKMIPYITAFIEGLPKDVYPEMPEEFAPVLVDLATLVTKARSSAILDSHGRLEHLPIPELPTRLVTQLSVLAKSYALIYGRTVVTVEDIQKVVRVALDSIPPPRAFVMNMLHKHSSNIRTLEVAGRYSDDLISVNLDILNGLGQVKKVADGSEWELTPDAAVNYATITPYLRPELDILRAKMI